MAKITIVLPCYNPEINWYANATNSFRAIESQFPNHLFQLIIVNDGSSKPVLTETEIASLPPQIKFINSSVNEGKGATLRKGMAAAESDFYIYTDIDFPYTNESVFCLIEKLLTQKINIVAGVRDNDYYKIVPPFRKKLSHFLRYWIAKSFKLKIDDTQCGLKGFDNIGKAIFMQTTINRYLFDLEFIFLASNNNEIRIEALPVKLKEGVIFSKMNLKILATEGLNFLKILLK